MSLFLDFNSTCVDVCSECKNYIGQVAYLLATIVGLIGLFTCGGAFERTLNYRNELEKKALHRRNNELKEQQTSQLSLSSLMNNTTPPSSNDSEKKKL